MLELLFTCPQKWLEDNFFWKEIWFQRFFFLPDWEKFNNFVQTAFYVSRGIVRQCCQKMSRTGFSDWSKWFQIFGKRLQAVLSKLHSSCHEDCIEVFLMKKHEIWSIIFPQFQAVAFQKSYRNWNLLNVKRHNWGKISKLRKRKSVKFCWTRCKIFHRPLKCAFFASTKTYWEVLFFVWEQN